MESKDYVIVAIFLVAMLAIGGFISFDNGKVVVDTKTGDGTGTGSGSGSGGLQILCQDDGTNSLDVVVRDGGVTTSSLYTAAKVGLFGTDGNYVTGSTGTTGGSTLTYTTLNVPCSAARLSGTAYVLASTGTSEIAMVNSKKATYDLTGKLADTLTIVTTNSTNLTLTIYSDQYANLSTTSTTGATSENGAVTMGASETRSGSFDVSGTTGNRQFGSDEWGVLWVIDTVDAAAFADTDITLTSNDPSFVLTHLDSCPQRAVSFDSGNSCYVSGPIRTSDGIHNIKFRMYSSLGNPGASSDPVLYIEDMQAFEENGKVTVDFATKDGTTVGQYQQSVTWNNA